MSNFHSVAPAFAVADIEATIRWYAEHLGFTAHPFPPQGPYVFAIMSRDNIEIMLQRIEGYEKPNLYKTRAGGVWDAYFRMEGVRDLFDSIREKVTILLPLCQQPYGDWEFEVADLNGYVLVFSEGAED
jgi:uncharacterized glyoxalase superfamily protein PhnB